MESGASHEIPSSASLAAAVAIYDGWVNSLLMPLKMFIDAYAPHLSDVDLVPSVSLGVRLASLKAAARATQRWDSLDQLKAATRDLAIKIKEEQARLSTLRFNEHRYRIAHFVEGIGAQYDWLTEQSRQLRQQHLDPRNSVARILDDVRHADNNQQLELLRIEALSFHRRFAEHIQGVNTEGMPEMTVDTPRPSNQPPVGTTAGLAGQVASGIWADADHLVEEMDYDQQVAMTDTIGHAVWISVCDVVGSYAKPGLEVDWPSIITERTRREDLARAMASRTFVVLAGEGLAHPTKQLKFAYISSLKAIEGPPDWSSFAASVCSLLRDRMIRQAVMFQEAERRQSASPDLQKE